MDQIKPSIFKYIGSILLLLISIITTHAYADSACTGTNFGQGTCELLGSNFGGTMGCDGYVEGEGKYYQCASIGPPDGPCITIAVCNYCAPVGGSCEASTEKKCCNGALCGDNCILCTEKGSDCEEGSKCCSLDESATCENKCTPACIATGSTCPLPDSKCCSSDASATCANKCTPCAADGKSCNGLNCCSSANHRTCNNLCKPCADAGQDCTSMGCCSMNDSCIGGVCSTLSQSLQQTDGLNESSSPSPERDHK